MKNPPAEQEKNSTHAYNTFFSEVQATLNALICQGTVDRKKIDLLLNGGAADAVRLHVPRTLRSADGIFFSSKVLAEYVAARIKKKLHNGSTVGDPACGAGDLLLACARQFRKSLKFDDYIKEWDSRIFGTDIHRSFVDTARARLMLLAATKAKGKLQNTLSLEVFNNLKLGTYFEQAAYFAELDCIVMNPPFVTVQAPDECKWAKGAVQLAGLFLSTAVEHAKIGQEIVAILPDVLRSGSRYTRWRELIGSSCVIKDIHLYGRFDEKTDVDVFVIHLVKTAVAQSPASRIWQKGKLDSPRHKVAKVEDAFEVSVGAYVPFRAKKTDNLVDYLSVSDASPDKEVQASDKCHFNGTLHETPFVVIRRTSSPSDPRRVIPTLITGPGKIAVENHLIVIKPLDRTYVTCKRLMTALTAAEVDDWMNSTIRCRHLTTASVKNLPLSGWR